MDISIALAIFAIFACIVVGLIVNATTKPIKSKPIPGPWFSLPILGHLPLLGTEPWVTFTNWKKHYGPIFAIKMGTFDVVVLNESKLIKEAFSRPECCGRPPFELFKAGAQGKGIAFSDGPLVAEQRDFANKSLKGFCLRANVPEENIRLELNQVLEDIDKKCGRPVVVKGMFAVPVLNAIWSIFMGQRYEHDDPKVRQVADGLYNLATYDGPMAALSMFIPAITKFIPRFSGFIKKRQYFQDCYDFVKKALDELMPPLRAFGEPQNFKEAFMDEMERVGDNPASSFHPSHNCLKYSAGDMLIGSLESVSATLDWLLLYMAKHPEVQKRAQAEIDEKIGTTRAAALSDKDNTPYVEAVVQELLRFSSVAPLSGLLHRATENTVLHGYVIQKDTLIIGNTYGVHYDSDVWGDPENFRPERFIDESGAVDRNLMRTMLPFGTGKRNCIAENIARDEIYLYCVGILQRFKVSCDPDTSVGNTVGLLRSPEEFQLTFTRRFTE